MAREIHVYGRAIFNLCRKSHEIYSVVLSFIKICTMYTLLYLPIHTFHIYGSISFKSCTRDSHAVLFDILSL